MNNNCITTYTGRHIDPLHPDPDMICIEDIAHALSLICRGNGQVKTFFSVGQHCINCAREALARGYSRRVAFACLLHDASECYLSDVPRPFKKTLSGYKEQEKNLLDLIYEHYTENNPVEKNTVAGKAAKAKEKELEEWLRGLDGMDRLVDDYVGDKIPLWEKIMDRQGTVCCAWEKTAFEEGLKVGIRLMMEVYSL